MRVLPLGLGCSAGIRCAVLGLIPPGTLRLVPLGACFVLRLILLGTSCLLFAVLGLAPLGVRCVDALRLIPLGARAMLRLIPLGKSCLLSAVLGHAPLGVRCAVLGLIPLGAICRRRAH